ncbi:MAG: KH domain-containing protein [Candidatus Berkelbacteria bacterium]|nr:KH domain-containing protein [Candidatus Berkelbacteria bacterium]
MSGKTEITDQEFVESIVKAIVDHPDEVVTGRTLDERGVLIQLTVNREDMGKVIGREGRTAKAIRSLLRVFGARNESRINLKIVDPEGGTADIPEEPHVSEAPKEKTPKAEAPAPVAEPTPASEEKATGVF